MARAARGTDAETERMIKQLEQEGIVSSDSTERTAHYTRNIMYCANAGLPEEATKWMQGLLDDPNAVPDVFAFSHMIDALAKVGDCELARECWSRWLRWACNQTQSQ